LATVAEGEKVLVVSNSDVKTLEMGLHPGSLALVIHNRQNEHNLIVSVLDQRLVVPKEVASKIVVGAR